MCRPAMLPMMNRGNEAIWSKVIRNTNFCIQFMWQKGSTFLAIVTLSYIFALYRSPEKVFYFFKKSIQFACYLRLVFLSTAP
jgi:hypothetical protein